MVSMRSTRMARSARSAFSVCTKLRSTLSVFASTSFGDSRNVPFASGTMSSLIRPTATIPMSTIKTLFGEIVH